MAPARRNNKPPAAGQDEAHKATNHLESIVMAEQVGCLAFSSSETSRLAKEEEEDQEEEHEARNETKEKPKTNESQSQQVDTAKKLISLASGKVAMFAEKFRETLERVSMICEQQHKDKDQKYKLCLANQSNQPHKSGMSNLFSNQHSDVEEEPAMAGRAAQAGPEQVAESDGTSNADEKQEQQPQQECPEQPVDDTASNLANLLLAEALRRTDEAAESAEQQPTVALEEEEDKMQGSFNAKLAESQREKELQTFASLAQIEEKFNQIMRQNDEEIESQQKEQQEQQQLPRPTNDGDDQSDNKSLSEQQYHEAIEKAAREELERAARDSDEVEQMLYLRRSSSFSSLHSPGSPSSLSSLERPGEELEASGEQETPEEPHMGPDTGESNCEEAGEAEESKLAEQQPPEPIKSRPSIIQEEENDDDDDCKEEEQVTLSGSINKETSQSDEFCGRQVSEFNLKQLKQSAQEDVMVCDANRSSTEAARRLFDSLTRPSKRPGEPVVDGTGEEQPQRPKNGSLSSADSARGDEEDSDDYARDKLDIFAGRQHDNDCGSIKLVQRSGSSASSTSNNFGRTLVCSVSPTSQLAGSQTDLAASVGAFQEAHYAVEGEEMRQCRQAFRENRRLIEQAQNECRLAAAAASNQTHLAKFGTWTPGRQSSASRQTHRGQPHQLNCSNCHKRLYLVDKMELDFTRTKLNIHRHCFRCQVCSSLLRLETYAAIDSKLYCPSHVKAALPSTR